MASMICWESAGRLCMAPPFQLFDYGSRLVFLLTFRKTFAREFATSAVHFGRARRGVRPCAPLRIFLSDVDGNICPR